MAINPSGLVKEYWLSGGTGELAPGIYDMGPAGNPIGDPLGALPGAARNFTVGNGYLYDPSDPLGGVQLGEEGTNFLTVTPDGTVQPQVGRAQSYINQSTSLNVEYGLAGTTNIRLGNGELYVVPITFAKLNRTGYRWVTYEREDGSTALARYRADLTLREIRAQFPAALRFSRPGEIEAQALTGELFRLSASSDPLDMELWQQLLDAMGIDRDLPSSELSGAVSSWLETVQSEFAHAARYTFRP